MAEIEKTEEVTEAKEVKEEKKEVAIQEPTTFMNYMDASSLNKVYKNASILASSELVPDTYKNKPANVMIAMDMASRSNFGLMTIMQNLYLVKGHPAWSGQFCLAAIKACGKYSDVEYIWVGENDSDPNFGCFLKAIDLQTGKVVKGTTVNWRMVKNFGWDAKAGSQWKIMPEQMFKYRAATYFARTECPEVLLGIQTADEVKDIYGNDEPKREKETITLNAEVINQ